MDDLRELDARAALLTGWERREVTEEEYYKLPGLEDTLYCEVIWIKPNGVVYTAPPYYHSFPTACAELDEEMRKRGYYLGLHHYRDGWYAEYFIKVGPYATECEARTRTAVRALENAAPRQQVTKDRDDTTHQPFRRNKYVE